MDGSTLYRDGKMRKEKVLCVCVFYSGNRVGGEGETPGFSVISLRRLLDIQVGIAHKLSALLGDFRVGDECLAAEGISTVFKAKEKESIERR